QPGEVHDAGHLPGVAERARRDEDRVLQSEAAEGDGEVHAGPHAQRDTFAFGSACCKSLTPASVTFVWYRLRSVSPVIPLSSPRPLSVTLVLCSPRFLRFFIPARCLSPSSV